MQEGPSVAERLGYTAEARLLVIHADDFGMSHSVNRATSLAFENGWITSASIMATCSWFPEAGKFARAHPDVCLGVHLTLNSEWTPFRWGPVAGSESVRTLVDDDGYLPLVEKHVVENASLADVELELRAQIEKVRNAGIRISHFDSHMLTLLGSEGLLSTYLALSEEYGIPARVVPAPDFAEGKLTKSCELIDVVCEAVPDISADRWFEGYKAMLGPLPPGSYQLTVHLGLDDDEMRGATHDHPNWGSAWRQRDFDLVQSADFRKFLADEGFTLVSWRDLARALARPSSFGR
jgi:predicted glycoside hydrolase/deacetylase ChbG (UPF0249 family)